MLDGKLDVVLGFDLSGEAIEPSTIEKVLRDLREHGGNYLKIESLPDGNAARQLMQFAGRRGVLLDTGQYDLPVQLVSSVNGFNRALLGGYGVIAYDRYAQAALNSIRAARTVGQLIAFPHLVAHDSLLVVSGALGLTDTVSNAYVLYTPRRGTVPVTLPDAGQYPRRVSVIGPLGTRRSEVLRPPYDRTFTLMAGDDSGGGWMVIAPLE